MTKEAQKLNVVVVLPVCGITLLGILGYRMMFGKKSSDWFNVKSLSKKKKSQPRQTSVEPSKTEIVNDRELSISKDAIKEEIASYSTPEQLMVGLCKIIVKNKSRFDDQEEFLRKMIKLVYFNVLDPGWIEKAPRTVEDCEELLKKCGLWEEYVQKLVKKEDYSTPIVVEESTRVGIRRRHVRRPEIVK